MDNMQAAWPQEDQARELKLEFSATGSEYFRIWIVNLLLSIVTLGIYSAWAKVRSNQYFYSSTRLDGSSFEYHGNPKAILKGRILALILVGGYNLAFKISPLLGLAMMVALAIVMPVLVWRSMQFKLYNTSYRGIRFGFDGDKRSAYIHYLWLPLLVSLSLGLALPFVHQRVKRFQHSEARFGSTKFSFDASVGSFYRQYLIFFVFAFIGAIVFGIAGGLLGSAFGSVLPFDARAAIPLMAVGFVYLWLFSIWPLFQTRLQNLIWNHTQLGQHGFRSELAWGRLTFIYLTNLLGVIFTLGLFIPFAKVRALKYRLESASLLAAGSLDDFIAGVQQDVDSTGEGVADIIDLDLAL
ncbi:YjgN family protein [Massilia sp. YIM B04103]|uniref:YjgN family protein n=1 Tax=Massilia sp. YIM B04103 TaxID=2963106 RepID=UPI00210CE902|nr:YjgN family protein [Massilia sp. YIM B04103]